MPRPINKERQMGLNIIHFRLHVFNEHFSFCHSLSVCLSSIEKSNLFISPQRLKETGFIPVSTYISADIFICFSPYANQKLLGSSWVYFPTFIILSYSFLALDICMICLITHNQQKKNQKGMLRIKYSTASIFLFEGAFCNARTPLVLKKKKLKKIP